jgi:hypothetical protein
VQVSVNKSGQVTAVGTAAAAAAAAAATAHSGVHHGKPPLLTPTPCVTSRNTPHTSIDVCEVFVRLKGGWRSSTNPWVPTTPRVSYHTASDTGRGLPIPITGMERGEKASGASSRWMWQGKNPI